MRQKYLEEKEKQGQTGAAPTRWPWYEIFDNMLGGTAKIRGVPHGVDQGIRMPHEEIHNLSDDDDEESTPNATPTKANSTAPILPRTRAAKQPHCVGQLNKSAEKRRRKLSAGDHAIASAITDFSNGIIEIEKMKLEVIEKIIESEKQGREMVLQGQLQMAALFVEVLKAKWQS
ncbi:hypothetical protein M758_UG106800 [Ceratodon purpureus]|nr:hypothetical protein M758_UG106800 [Ceratodon purpureus]